MIKIAIIDDDPIAIKALERGLQEYQNTNVIGTAETGNEGLKMVKEKKPELLFLDIELPDMSGLEFIEQMNPLNDNPCDVVIYSTYDKYMLPAFRKEAFDFLIKPIEKTELKNIIDRCTTRRAKNELLNRNEEELPYAKKFLLYTNTSDFKVVKINNIGLFQYNSERRIWEVIIIGQSRPIGLKRSVNNQMILNFDHSFIQIHQSYIININYLIEVIDNKCHFFPPFDQIENIPVGRFFRKKLIDRFNNL